MTESEYACEGCGRRVLQLGRSQAPDSGWCAACSFLNAYCRDHFWAAYQALKRQREAAD